MAQLDLFGKLCKVSYIGIFVFLSYVFQLKGNNVKAVNTIEKVCLFLFKAIKIMHIIFILFYFGACKYSSRFREMEEVGFR